MKYNYKKKDKMSCMTIDFQECGPWCFFWKRELKTCDLPDDRLPTTAPRIQIKQIDKTPDKKEKPKVEKPANKMPEPARKEDKKADKKPAQKTKRGKDIPF